MGKMCKKGLFCPDAFSLNDGFGYGLVSDVVFVA